MAECQAKTKNGRVCGAHALKGEEYCFMHSPTRAAERHDVRRLGGMRRGSHTGDESSLPGKMRTVEDVLKLLDYIREELLSLHNGIARARELRQLAGEYIHTIEISDIERRIAALEEASR